MKSDFPRRTILMVFTLLPYPLRSTGLSVRYLPIIDHLSRNHAVDILLIDGQQEGKNGKDGLERHCRKLMEYPDPGNAGNSMYSRIATYCRYLLPWTPPLSFVAHNGKNVTRCLVEATRGNRYDRLVWVGSYLVPYLLDALPDIAVEKTFIDFIDSPSLLKSRSKEKVFDAGLLDRYELWKTKTWEGKLVRKVDSAIYISRIDADTVPSLRTDKEKKHVIPNGVSVESFSEAGVANVSSPNIGFLGNMGYPPNIEAVHWLHENVFIPMKKENPALSLILIGRDPTDSIRGLAESPGVVVTGTVGDIWSYIKAIDVFLFPLFRGAGLKNKILEAMYAGRPVVTTGIGNEGIDAKDGRDLVIGRTAEDFRREAAKLLGSPDERGRMGAAARSYVEGRFSWDRILRDYESLICGELPADENGLRREAGPVPRSAGNR